MRFPSDVTGQPDANDRFLFQYYSDGMIATRTDQRGIVFTHVYDELRRRVESKVNDVAWFSGPQGTNAPPNQVRRINYAYAPTGEPTQVTAYSSLSTSANYTAKSVFAYDSFRNLESELQYHWGSGGPVNGLVAYDWSSGTQGYTQAT